MAKPVHFTYELPFHRDPCWVVPWLEWDDKWLITFPVDYPIDLLPLGF